MAPRRATLTFIFLLVAMDILAMGIIIPVLPKLVERFMGGDTAGAAEVYGLFGTGWGLMQFFFMPVLGMLSDRFGRRPVILISCLGLGLDYFVMALAPNLAWLFVGRLISGITAASISTAFAYIADVTPPEKRAGAFGIMGAAFGVGFVFGPALGGVLGGVDPRLPFWVAGTLALANAAYGWFVLPESLPKDKRAPFAWKRANPLGSLKLLRSHPELFGLAAVLFLMNLAHVVLPSVAVLYMGYRYGWGELAVGLVLAGVGVCAMIVQGGLVRKVVPRIGERKALALGLCFGALGFFIYGLAPVGWMFLVAVPVMSIWGFAGPSAQALMTRHVGPSEQGQLQGATASLTSLAGLFGPALFTQTFAASILVLPGAPFLLAGALLVAAMILGWRVTRQ
jgi:DHA1 family tetracycline resistance protein-like MFS transporter